MNKTFNILQSIKTATIILFVCFLSKEVAAQNEPMYSQYMFNMMATNPAYAGSRGAIGFNYFGRAQWSGIGGAPTTNSISLDGATSDGRIGLGMQLYNDKIGVYSNNTANFMVASRIKVSENGVLSGGLTLGIRNNAINLTNVRNIYDPNDIKFQQNQSNWDPILGMGVYYNTDKFYLGASIPNIMSSANIKSGQTAKTNDYHMFVSSGVVLDLTDDIKIKPSTLIKMSSGAPIELDLNTNLWFMDMFGIGASLRTGDAYVGMVEWQLNKQLRLGYAYDYTTSDLRRIAGSTHEVMFRYEFGRDSKNVKSTRYF